METVDESRTVWQSIDNIVGMERSLQAFWVAVQEELDAIGGDAMAFVEEDAHSSTNNPEYHWAYTGECRPYRVETSDGDGDPVLKGVVSVRIELWRKAGERSESVWRHAKTPFVYVAFHRYPDPDSDGVGYYGVDDRDFGLDQYGKPYHEGEEGDSYRARTPLWVWNRIADDVDEWIKSSWFFAVPLVEISSYDELREQITEPFGSCCSGTGRRRRSSVRGAPFQPRPEMDRGQADDQRERDFVESRARVVCVVATSLRRFSVLVSVLPSRTGGPTTLAMSSRPRSRGLHVDRREVVVSAPT